MEVKFSVSCRYEYEAEDAQNGVDKEKMKDHCDASCAFSMPRSWSGGVMGVISQPALWACTKMLLRSKVNCCVCKHICSQQVQFVVSLLFHLFSMCAFFVLASAWNDCIIYTLSHFVRYSCMLRRLRPGIHGNALLHVFASFCHAALFCCA